MMGELKKEPRLLALTRDATTPHLELAESKGTSEGYLTFRWTKYKTPD